MPYYVKITKQVREVLLPSNLSVTRSFDGNYIVYQSALADVKGDTLMERVEHVGGALLTTMEAKQEMAGEISKECHTPEEYDDGAKADSVQTDAGHMADTRGAADASGAQMTQGTQDVNIPEVDGSAYDGQMPAEETDKSDSNNENSNQEESEVENE